MKKPKSGLFSHHSLWWIVDHSVLSVTAVFVLIGVFKFFVDNLLLFHTPTMPLIEGEIFDASGTAVLGSLTFGTFLSLAVKRRRYMQQEVDKIAALNHEVRNSLQVILGAEMMHSNPAEEVIESVKRIERTVRELFPL
jgi:hypothetical protein